MNNISIVIVTFNSQETIGQCLESVIKYSPNAQIIVVDNNSQDQTTSVVKNFDKKVKLINSGENLGFSKANNLGVKSATNNYLIFLNPDTRLLREQSLETLVDVLVKNPKYGIVAPKLIYPDKREQMRIRQLPTVLGAFQEYVLGIKSAYGFYKPNCQSLCEVGAVIGACLVISKDLFNMVDGFNEKYFMYFEDLELCRNVQKQKLKIGYYPKVIIEHFEGISGFNQKTNDFLHNSAKKYHGLLSYLVIQNIIKIGRLLGNS